MAQLTDDCFAFSGPLLRLEEMKRLIGDRISPVRETEFVALHGACGRVTAADLKAPVNLPPFDNSAVDGYAVRHADLNRDSDTRLRLSGRLTAGEPARIGLGAAEAIRIFTGATMPGGADTVFMQEDVRLEGDHVVVPNAYVERFGAGPTDDGRLVPVRVAVGAFHHPVGRVVEPGGRQPQGGRRRRADPAVGHFVALLARQCPSCELR